MDNSQQVVATMQAAKATVSAINSRSPRQAFIDALYDGKIDANITAALISQKSKLNLKDHVVYGTIDCKGSAQNLIKIFEASKSYKIGSVNIDKGRFEKEEAMVVNGFRLTGAIVDITGLTTDAAIENAKQSAVFTPVSTTGQFAALAKGEISFLLNQDKVLQKFPVASVNRKDEETGLEGCYFLSCPAVINPQEAVVFNIETYDGFTVPADDLYVFKVELFGVKSTL